MDRSVEFPARPRDEKTLEVDQDDKPQAGFFGKYDQIRSDQKFINIQVFNVYGRLFGGFTPENNLIYGNPRFVAGWGLHM